MPAPVGVFGASSTSYAVCCHQLLDTECPARHPTGRFNWLGVGELGCGGRRLLNRVVGARAAPAYNEHQYYVTRHRWPRTRRRGRRQHGFPLATASPAVPTPAFRWFFQTVRCCATLTAFTGTVIVCVAGVASIGSVVTSVRCRAKTLVSATSAFRGALDVNRSVVSVVSVVIIIIVVVVGGDGGFETRPDSHTDTYGSRVSFVRKPGRRFAGVPGAGGVRGQSALQKWRPQRRYLPGDVWRSDSVEGRWRRDAQHASALRIPVTARDRLAREGAGQTRPADGSHRRCSGSVSGRSP